MIVFIIVLIVIVFLAYKFYKNNYHLTYNNITYFQGEVGSGKTTILTYLALKERKNRLRHNFIRKLICWIPGIKNVFPVKNCEIYSTYPIWIDKKTGYSKVIDKNILNWEYRIKEGAIVVLDEMEMIFPNSKDKTEAIYAFGTAFIRHGTNALIFASSQSLTEVNISFRRRVNSVYMLSNCKRGLFSSSVLVHKAFASEEFTNVFEDKNDETKNVFRFRLPGGHFQSRYAKKLYELPQDKIIYLSQNYDKILLSMQLKNGDQWRSLYWDIEIA